ncbi:MAG: ATP-binding cassette domain-containing protein, partial [bacterium]
VSMMQVRAFQAGVLLPLAFVNLFVIVVYAVVIVILDPVMGAAAIAVVLVSTVVSLLLLLRRRELQEAASTATVSLSEQTTRVVTDMETIKASAAEQWVFDRWSQERSGSAEATSALEVDGQRLGLVSPFTQAAGLGIMLALGSLLVFRGTLDLGSFVAIQALLTSMLIPAGQIVWLGVLAEGVASPQRLADEVLDLPVDVEVSARGDVDIPGSGPVALSVLDVRFGYGGLGGGRAGEHEARGERPRVDGLSLEIPAGAWLAVVGGSGSGKSTLARLCVGELQPWSGEILLDGVPRLTVERAARCAAVGYVPQYPQLTPGTILDNVRMFDPSITEAAVVDALRTACVLDAIDRRPGGLQEMVLATGHGFSGGELQRLAIARALVRGPRLLVLDEATSALDPIVEVQLEERLRELSLTCLVIAHRLSTVRDADQIVVLERGSLVQRGTFDDLRLEGRFRELVHG